MFIRSNDSVLLVLPTSLLEINISEGTFTESEFHEISVEHFPINGAVLSPCRRFVCLINDEKRLTCYSRYGGGWKICSSIVLPRRSTCILFSGDGRYLFIGEKSGSVYKLPFSTSAEKCFDSQQLSLIFGHLSILTDMAVSSDNQLLATGDRDAKIRISRSGQPYVIESFCLGHTSFITQLSFLPGGHHLMSAGADGYLRLWKADTGRELSHKKIDFLTDPTEPHRPPVVSHMFIPEAQLCVGCCSMYPVVFGVQFNVTDDNSVFWSTLSQTTTPGGQPLRDCTISVSDSGLRLTALTTSTPVRMWQWTLTRSNDAVLTSGPQWSEATELTILPADVLSRISEEHPRKHLLSSLVRSGADLSMLDTYEARKTQHHQNVSDRRYRHQRNRRRNKVLQGSVTVV